MDLVRVCAQIAGRPRVVHRLPGRLRVRVPHLRRLSRKHQGVADAIGELLAVADGVDKVSASLDSGNMLVHYDPGRLGEKDILGYLRGVMEIFLRHRERFAAVPADRLPEVIGRLEPVLRAAVRPGLAIRTDVEIGDDVLA
jgi:hypothetical protein